MVLWSRSYILDLLAGLPGGGDTNVLWGDATYAADMFTIGVQGGNINPDEIPALAPMDDTTAWGAKISGKLGMFDLSCCIHICR